MEQTLTNFHRIGILPFLTRTAGIIDIFRDTSLLIGTVFGCWKEHIAIANTAKANKKREVCGEKNVMVHQPETRFGMKNSEGGQTQN